MLGTSLKPPLNAPQSVDDYRLWTKQRLDPLVWQHLAAGDNDENSKRALAQILLMPRPLKRLQDGHTKLKLFGQMLSHPIVLAPVAYQRLFHQDGDIASAMACAAQDGQMAISSLASHDFKEIVHAIEQGNGSPPWFQLYWQGNKDSTLQLLQRAIATGVQAIVFTVDAPIKIATLQLPHNVQAVNLDPTKGSVSTKSSAVFTGWMANAPCWEDVKWLRQQTSLPLIIKGILHPDDAVKAIDYGCDGIIVSNHGGRVLSGSPPTLDALRHIVKRIGNRVPILMDSGIRSGRDVFVALSHGATAVLLGRPYIWGLAANGAMGVAHVIRLIRDELEMTMALTGCQYLEDIQFDCCSRPSNYV